MNSIDVDAIEPRLVGLLQVGFPLTREPYAALGLRLGISGDEVIRRIQQLKARGIVRQISPVLDGRTLGYQTTLVAMRVEESQLEQAERLIAEHPGVSHGYEREHYFNIWFTLAVPPGAEMDADLQRLSSTAGAEVAFALPAIKLFKIYAYFAIDGDTQSAAGTVAHPGGILPEKVELSQTDRLIINELQQDLPLIQSPFSAMSSRLGMEVEDFLVRCQILKQSGIMRRYGAAINHKRAGFTANAMACWIAPDDKVNIAGQKLASIPEVSHCYERKTNPLWRYNLFAVIHGESREACHKIAYKVTQEIGLSKNENVLLFSTREFKKARVKYVV